MNIPSFELERWAAEFENEVSVDLGQSSASETYLNEILEFLTQSQRRLFGQMSLSYVDARGTPSLRRQLAVMYELDIENIVITNGASEALFLLNFAIAENESNMVVVAPCYQSLTLIPRAFGSDIRNWDLSDDLRAPPTFEALQSLVDSQTRAVVINFPHNPSGVDVDDAWMTELAAILNDRDILLIADEVFKPISFNPANARRHAVQLGDNCVSIGDMSKAYGLGGLRVGWIAMRDTVLMKRILSLKDFTTISVSALSQEVARIALEHDNVLLDRKIEEATANIQLLEKELEALDGRISFSPPEGGLTVFPRVLGIADTTELCRGLATRYSINLVPGAVFGVPDRVRIGLGLRNREAKKSYEWMRKSMAAVLKDLA